MTKPPTTKDSSQRIGQLMVYAAWIIAVGLLTWFFSHWLDKENNPNQRFESQITEQGVREIKLVRNRYGHYVATGSINGYPVDFLLDTGATTLSIPQPIAQRIGLKPIAPYQVQTANGVITVYATLIDRIDLGAISLRNVRGHINPYMDENDEILLGMTVLKRLELIQRGNTLTLRQY